MATKEFNTSKIQQASPLELPFVIMETELHDQQAAFEVYEQASREFEGEGIINNVLDPVFAFMIDSLFQIKYLKSMMQKTGLNGNTIIRECQSFNYDGKIAFLNPDACIEEKNIRMYQCEWGAKKRPKYSSAIYKDEPLMNRYKDKIHQDSGNRVNMLDEYMMTKNISRSQKTADKRRNDPKHYYNAEADHITPLRRIFEQLQNNSGLTDSDIRRIANQEENFAVTSKRINNKKRARTNSEFIQDQDDLKAQGKSYIEISPEQRANMIQMEKDAAKYLNSAINDTVKKNILFLGEVERIEHKKAVEAKAEELGRQLTEDEIKTLDRKIAMEKSKGLYKGNLGNAGKQSLMYLIGNGVLLLIKPLYYEIKDIFVNGLLKGVGATSVKEAITIRFNRIRHYIWSNLVDLSNLGGLLADIIKNCISTLIEGLISMFVSIWKQALKVLKEGIKVLIQAWKICFGKESKDRTAAEKGDAIVKLVGGSLMTLCGIGINILLQRMGWVDENTRTLVSSLLSGIASVLFFYLLDKADLFNVKKQQRENRIREIFEMRIQEVKEKTAAFDEAVTERIRETYMKSRMLLDQITESAKKDDFNKVNEYLLAYQQYMAPGTLSQTPNWDC